MLKVKSKVGTWEGKRKGKREKGKKERGTDTSRCWEGCSGEAELLK